MSNLARYGPLLFYYFFLKGRLLDAGLPTFSFLTTFVTVLLGDITAIKAALPPSLLLPSISRHYKSNSDGTTSAFLCPQNVHATRANFGSMPRTTRSGAEFSPYTLNGFEYDPGPPTVIETGISLGPYLEAALAAADRRCRSPGGREQRGRRVGDDLEVASRPPSPTSDASSSPASSRPSTPQPSPSTLVAASPLPPSDTVDEDAEMPMPILLPGGDVEHNRWRDAARTHRERKRRTKRHEHRTTKDWTPALTNPTAHWHPSALALREEEGKGGVKGRRVRKLWTVEELKALGYRRIKWDGKHPMVIVDRDGRIVAVFVGKPDDRKVGQPRLSKAPAVQWDRAVAEG
ncbi:hypothetical protein B0H11DRAFT_1939098, partial [Mycena galericulata]